MRCGFMVLPIGLLLAGCPALPGPGEPDATAHAVLGQAPGVAAGMLGLPFLGGVPQGAIVAQPAPAFPTAPQAGRPPPVSTPPQDTTAAGPPTVDTSAFAQSATMRQGPAGMCQCIDRGDIVLRLHQARAAVRVYREQIEVIRAQEQRTGKVVDWTEERRLKLQGIVEDALTEIVQQSGRIGTAAVGKTEPLPFCTEFIEPFASPCMKQAVHLHEAVHQKACTVRNRWNMTLIAYAEEEIEAYQTEIAFLEEELRKLPCGFVLEFDSEIVGGVMHGPLPLPSTVRSQVYARVVLEDDKSTGSLVGQAPLEYQTVTTQPLRLPRGNLPPCEWSMNGRGQTSFEVREVSRIPREGPLTDLEIVVSPGHTSEKWDSTCGELPPVTFPFQSEILTVGWWTASFNLARYSDGGVPIRGWSIVNRDGVVATKTIQSQCGGMCESETTTLTLRGPTAN
jgi:hypothetical protein